MSLLERMTIARAISAATLALCLNAPETRANTYDITADPPPMPYQISAAAISGTIPNFQPNMQELDPALYYAPYIPIHLKEAYAFLNSQAVQCKLYREVQVAVIDSGINPDHPEFLGAKLGAFIDFVDPSNTVPIDEYNHGTAVSSIIGGSRNHLGSLGLGDEISTVHSLRVFDRNGGGSVLSVTDALRWAIDHDVDVINMSLSTGSLPTVWEELIAEAEEKNIAIVAATGTVDSDMPRYPASIPNVFAVGATNASVNDRNTESAYGSQLQRFFMAPGDGLIAPFHTGYGTFGGTSGAAAVITEVLVAMAAINPNLTNEEKFALLQVSTIDLETPGFDEYTGYGAVDALAALQNTFTFTWEGIVSPVCPSYKSYVPIAAFKGRFDQESP